MAGGDKDGDASDNNSKSNSGGGSIEKRIANIAKETNSNKEFEDDAMLPAGSWVQHLHKNGYMFWRNNYTGQCTRDLFFDPFFFDQCLAMPTSLAPTQRNHLEPASFAPIFIDNKGKVVSAKASDKADNKDKRPASKSWHGHPWEEIYNPVTGKKHWRHRGTGKEKQTDPLR